MSKNKSHKELEGLLRLFQKTIPPDIVAEADLAAREKNQIKLMLPFIHALTELVNTQAVLPPNSDPAARKAALYKLCNHAKGLIEDAVVLFKVGRFATSQFLAITAIEEVGKISVAKIQAITNVCPPAVMSRKTKKGDKSLFRHPDKHYLAACAGAVINSRLDRILGRDRIIEFLKVAESKALELVRQNALYYQLQGINQHLPIEAVSESLAREYLVIAAELLVEVGFCDPVDWEEMLKWAEGIEHHIGLHQEI